MGSVRPPPNKRVSGGNNGQSKQHSSNSDRIERAEHRLVRFNDRYVEMYQLLADKIVPGVTFQELGAASIERGLFQGDVLGQVEPFR